MPRFTLITASLDVALIARMLRRLAEIDGRFSHEEVLQQAEFIESCKLQVNGETKPERADAHCWYRPKQGGGIKMGNWRDGDPYDPKRLVDTKDMLERGYLFDLAYRRKAE